MTAPRRARRTAMAFLLTLLCTAACGTRVQGTAGGTGPQLTSQNTVSGQPENASAAPAAGDTAPGAGGNPTLSTSTTRGAVTGRSDAPAGATGRGTAAAGVSVPGAAASTAPAAAGGPSTPATAPPTNSGPGPAVPTPGAGAAPAKGSTVTVGVVGTLSGPVGAAYAAGPPTLGAWKRMVNERGGIAGHPVEVIFGDDGGDPARHRSLLQDFVENRKVIAFVGNPAPLTGTAGRAYLEQKRVPVIGGDLASAAWHESPMFFPQGTTLPEMLVATIATGAKFTTKKKLGIATCAEAQACRDAYDQWPDVARRFGLDLVYRAQVSLAQPDFTAECLGARNAGVELFATVVDVTGVSRFSTSCGRQRFKPTYLFIQTVVDDREKSDPNLQGAYGAVATFPWPANDSPGTSEYHATMRRFAPNVSPAASSTQLWTAAKIFERAAAVLADPPDRGKLIDTLYSLKNETFGGLTQPITYNKDAAASRVPCWFVQTIRDSAWVAPQGSRPVCP